MAISAIVSYDGTENDRDALALARTLADVGARPTLAYVRHSTRSEPTRELLEAHQAEALLERGARRLDDPYVEQRVVVSPSTGEGLKWLADQEHADLVVFGSDYRTALGHVAPGRSAQTLLGGGPATVALAPAGYHMNPPAPIARVGLITEPDDDEGLASAQQLSDAFDAELIRGQRGIDMLLVGSREEAPAGRVMITARAHNLIESATVPVLVLARGVVLEFSAAFATA